METRPPRPAAITAAVMLTRLTADAPPGIRIPVAFARAAAVLVAAPPEEEPQARPEPRAARWGARSS